jgi:hypothetical protein
VKQNKFGKMPSPESSAVTMQTRRRAGGATNTFLKIEEAKLLYAY